MTVSRYLAFAGPVVAVESIVAAARPSLLRLRLPNVLDHGGLQVFASGTPVVALGGERGLVLGRLFRRSDDEPVTELDGDASRCLVASEGRTLIDTFWGSYVAFLDDPEHDRRHVVRDPSGAVQVYLANDRGISVYFSDVELPLGLCLVAPEVDPAFARHWLTYSHLRTARTGLLGVSEILPGERSTTSVSGEQRSALWVPWDHTKAETQFAQPAAAVAAVGEMTRRCVTAQARGRGNVLIELSGGLDSSIIAACLAADAIEFSAVNFVSDFPDGDETQFARAVASALSAPLAEVRAPSLESVLQPGRRRLRPGSERMLLPIDAALAAEATASDANVILSGTGGDNVFCYLTTAAPALDALYSRGAGAAIEALSNIATLCDCTIWAAASGALRKHRRAALRPLWPQSRDFLSTEMADEGPDPHPWLPAPTGTLPGKREHVEMLMGVQHVLDTNARAEAVPMLFPLLSQPLVETCLRVPTWMWIDGGRNRSVARDAFAGALPASVLRRRTKGRLERLCVRTFLDNRAELRSLLVDGLLARDGLIDAAAAAAYLDQPGDPRDFRHYRLFEIANLELWLRSWD